MAFKIVRENKKRCLFTSIGFGVASLLLVIGLFYTHVTRSVVEDNFNHALLEQRVIFEEVYVPCVTYYDAGEELIPNVTPVSKNVFLSILSSEGVETIKVEYNLFDSLIVDIDGKVSLVDETYAVNPNYDVISEALANSIRKEQKDFEPIVAGKALDPDNPMTVMVGEATVAYLGMTNEEIVGKEVTVTANNGKSYKLTVTGVYANEMSTYYLSDVEYFREIQIKEDEINDWITDFLFHYEFFEQIKEDDGMGEKLYPHGIYVTMSDVECIDELGEKMIREYDLSYQSSYESYYYQIKQQEKMSNVFLLLGGFVLLLVLLMIFNTIAINITQQKRLIGVLRLLGFTKAKIRIFYMFQSLIFCAIGTSVGAGLGFIFSTYYGQQIASSVSDFGVASSNFLLPAGTLILAVSIIFAVSIIGGYCIAFFKTLGKRV